MPKVAIDWLTFVSLATLMLAKFLERDGNGLCMPARDLDGSRPAGPPAECQNSRKLTPKGVLLHST
jgi:hypothetical protein